MDQVSYTDRDSYHSSTDFEVCMPWNVQRVRVLGPQRMAAHCAASWGVHNLGTYRGLGCKNRG